AQLDRFLLRTRIGYPSLDAERQLLARRVERAADEVEITPVVDAPTLVEMQRSLEQVHVADSIVDYIARLVRATRENPRVQVGASPRGGLALLKLARGRAILDGRGYVTPEDVKAVAVPALAHRLTLAPELWLQQLRGDEVVGECLEQVPTPTADDLAPPRT
ncbi:MAG TPA: MoxR family ATPase, partial [Gaiellaceae bacterium]|nr:MoxR family ATPase [Gaiellaceae bacterium]